MYRCLIVKRTSFVPVVLDLRDRANATVWVMARSLPARYQIIRQNDQGTGEPLGLLYWVVEFLNGKCVVAENHAEGSVLVFSSLKRVKETYATNGASLERID